MANYDDIFTAPVEQKIDEQQSRKEDYAAKMKAERERVFALADQTATDVCTDGDAFRNYLNVQSRFDRYSATNALLICAQRDDATQLRDFDGWKNKGVYVQKDEKGISILEPGDSFKTEDGATGTYYNVKKVFDISQTNAKPQAAPQVHYDERALLSALIAKRPVPIAMTDNLPGGAVYDHDKKTIFVRRGMEAQDIFRSVSLALARAELAQRDGAEPQNAAFKAYCVSYMLGCRYSVDVSSYDFRALPDNLKNADPQAIRSELSEIRDTLNTMTGRMARAMEQNRAAAPKEQER